MTVYVEDPRRMRTKLRLDLKDVRKQIEDMEELLKADKSAENVEAHQKLLEYEQKLKDQYEKMTGLSLDQANNLEDKYTKGEEAKKSNFALFLGVLGGALISYGFYNLILHSILGFAPTDVLNYLNGDGNSIGPMLNFVASIKYGSSLYLVVGPLGAGALLIFLGTLMDGTRSFGPRFLEGLGFISSVGLLIYILMSGDEETVSDQFVNLMLIYTIAILLGGLFILLGGLSNKGVFSKLLGIATGGTFIYAGVRYLIVILEYENFVPNGARLVLLWPYITLPIIIGSGIYSFLRFIKMFS